MCELGYTEFRMVSMESNLFEKIVCICRYQSSISRFGTQLIISNRTYLGSDRSNDSIEPLSLVCCFSSNQVNLDSRIGQVQNRLVSFLHNLMDLSQLVFKHYYQNRYQNESFPCLHTRLNNRLNFQRSPKGS